MRTEQDSLGQVKIPKNALYGAQTQRALTLYPTQGQKTLGDYPELVKAILLIKAVAAQTNLELRQIDPKLGSHIAQGCYQLIDHYQTELYPVHAFHGGGGISANMNLNEVIANWVNSHYYQGQLGHYQPAHPNDHINLNHSTSDCLQSAYQIAARAKLQALTLQLNALKDTLEQLKKRHKTAKKISRTCLQDAVTISFAQFWQGWQSSIDYQLTKLLSLEKELLKINLGANIIGRAGDCAEGFTEKSLENLRQASGENYQKHKDFFQCSQSFDCLNHLTSQLENTAHCLLKISQDLRLMASGPETGLAEIQLPAVQPGSSAMPGKINPTVPEYMIQCSFQTLGHCQAIKLTAQQGELDYNPWGMLLITNLLDALMQLGQGIHCLNQHSLLDLRINPDTAEKNSQALVPMAVELKKHLGYQKTCQLLKQTQYNKILLQQQLDLLQNT